MKKYILKITALVLFMGAFASCEEDKVMYGGDQALAAFVKTTATLPVVDTGVSSVKIGVTISTVSTASRVIPVTVDAKSTALASQYKIDAATLVIPAGAYLGEIVVTGDFDNLNANETVKLILNLGNLDNATLEPTKKSFELLIYKACTSTLGGTYAYSTTKMGEPGGGRVAGPVTGNVTFTATTPGVYAISDASFGGWIGLYGPGNIAKNVKLTDICNKIAYSGKDQYDEIFTFSNLVVNGTKLSFHWVNDYGEFGDTTLTRTDGKNWPNLKL
ncbi:hypothetical protein [Flavobacterium sp. K5-23]|uniref:hypothetical protein n=1 Tax=Flavobacterium sp. K5-23 TaxID=2746225 RepID=UPI00200D6B1C|nr:hypothetical protein [Flavobacterium sp. K5-23]UQD54913.1 hypothetical protein FLAK523_00350 [Flavobacterium sp. K5-23]